MTKCGSPRATTPRLFGGLSGVGRAPTSV
ncbi:hypothetical protein A2U01_0103889, partial [Trifolium medium]|nr:hypothetical protein [Trifolium medium]